MLPCLATLIPKDASMKAVVVEILLGVAEIVGAMSVDNFGSEINVAF